MLFFPEFCYHYRLFHLYRVFARCLVQLYFPFLATGPRASAVTTYDAGAKSRQSVPSQLPDDARRKESKFAFPHTGSIRHGCFRDSGRRAKGNFRIGDIFISFSHD